MKQYVLLLLPIVQLYIPQDVCRSKKASCPLLALYCRWYTGFVQNISYRPRIDLVITSDSSSRVRGLILDPLGLSPHWGFLGFPYYYTNTGTVHTKESMDSVVWVPEVKIGDVTFTRMTRYSFFTSGAQISVPVLRNQTLPFLIHFIFHSVIRCHLLLDTV
jgi:hypothetical protein